MITTRASVTTSWSAGARDCLSRWDALYRPSAHPLETVHGRIRPFQTGAAALEINRVLRNTYLLLGSDARLQFGRDVCRGRIGRTVSRILSDVDRLLRSAVSGPAACEQRVGLLAVFAFTGFLGYSLGPLLSIYLKLPNGPQLVGQALGLTSVAFVGLSACTR